MSAQKEFASRRQVALWLKEQDRWQVSERTVYNHIKDGRLRPGPEGNFTLAAVKKYARQYLVEIGSGSTGNENLGSLQEQRLKEEVALKKAQREKLERQKELAEGRLMPVADLELEIASRSAVLFSGLNYEIYQGAPEWLRQLGFDPARGEDLAAVIWAAISDRLSEYARVDEYQVIEKKEGLE